MGTFLGHIVPGLLLILLGIWHAFSTNKSYNLKGPKNFTSKIWYPFNSKHKQKELIFIFLFSLLSVLMLLLEFPLLNFSFQLINFEHATMFFHLAIFALFTLFADLNPSSNSLSKFSSILGASFFGQQLFLLRFHSADHIGLEGHYHWLLQLIVFVSFSSALTATACPASFPAALILSISVLFQGCWFMNMGFNLWFPKFAPKACRSEKYMFGKVTCETHGAELRGKAVANLQFSWILSGILVITGLICLSLDRKCNLRGQSTDYEQLHSSRVGDGGQITIVTEGPKPAYP